MISLEANEHYQKGNRYLKDVNNKKLKEGFKKTFPFPKIAIDFLWVDTVYLDKEDIRGLYQKAMNEYDKALEIDSEHFLAAQQKGIIFRELGAKDKAIECFQKAVEIYPEFIEGWINLGIEYEQSDEINRAIECYEIVLRIEPKLPEIWYRLGEIYEKLDSIIKSDECFLNADKHYKELQKSESSDYNGMEEDDSEENEIGSYKMYGTTAKAYFKGRYREALKSSVTWSHIGVAYGMLGEHRKAIECFQKDLQQYPKSTQALCNIGIAFYSLKEYKKALEYHKKALEALEYFEELFKEKAGHDYDEIYDRFDRDDLAEISNVLDKIGHIYKKLGDFIKADECYHQSKFIFENFVLPQFG